MNKLLLLTYLILLIVFESFAQQPDKTVERTEAEELVKKVVSLYQSGKYNEALPLAEKAVLISETGTNSKLTAAALFNLGEIQIAKGKNKDAEATYDRYLAVYEKVVGENDPKFISSLDQYVCKLIGFNRRSKALEIQKRIYSLDNKFDFNDTGKPLTKSMEMAGLSSGSGVILPRPAYLDSAKMQRVSGSVIFKVDTDETGEVLGVKTLCGHPLLIQGSEHSIQQSRFKPTIVSGKPVKVTFIAIYNFVL